MLGETIADPVVDLEMEDAECIYETKRAPGRPAVMVELTMASLHNATFTQRAQFFRNEGAKPITGIGTDAYALGGHILTQKPGVILFISVSDGRSDDQHLLQGARSLTSSVLNRLP